MDPINTPTPANVMSSPKSPSVPAVAGGGEDGARLDWLEDHHVTAKAFCEGDDDQILWWQIQDRDSSLSGHPLGSVRDAIDAAIAATKAKEGK